MNPKLSTIRKWAPALLLLLPLTLPPRTLAQAPVTNGLVNRWSGDGTAKDAAGSDDGKVSGNLRYVQGPNGQAFQFNGTDAGIDFGAAPGNVGQRDFSIAYWMKTTSSQRTEAFLEKRRTCDAADAFWSVRLGGLPPDPGHISMTFTKGGGQSVLGAVSTRPLNDGVWHHVVWVRQSTSAGGINVQLYVDGVLDAESEHFANGRPDNQATFGWTADVDNSNPVVLGQSPCQCCDGTRPYSGAAAELQIFSHALSAEDVTAIYQGTKPRK